MNITKASTSRRLIKRKLSPIHGFFDINVKKAKGRNTLIPAMSIPMSSVRALAFEDMPCTPFYSLRLPDKASYWRGQ